LKPLFFVVRASYVVAGDNHRRTLRNVSRILRKASRKNLITFGKSQNDTTSPAAIMKKTAIGKNTANKTETTASTSSARLATTFETGSGLVFMRSLVAAFVP
jgi:hypothetical protein